MGQQLTRLFCFPFAGGSSYSYKSMEPFLEQGIQMITPEIPGRGKRISEALITDAHLLANDLFRQIRMHLKDPYAFYGHSMGTLLGYLLTHRIALEGLPLPNFLFFTGRGGPSFKKEEPLRYNLPQQEFFDELRSLGGCPDEILQDEQMMELFEPILRADFELVETFEYESHFPLPIPIHIAYGEAEDLLEEEILSWQLESRFPISVIMFPGNHFFIYDQKESVIALINEQVNKHNIKYGASSLS
jgi:surfactin synthase thioesterase subunit